MQTPRWITWNIFLAVVPVCIAYATTFAAESLTVRRKRVPWIVWAPFLLAWLAFLPNTCYLLTEWRHFLFDPHFETLRNGADTNRALMLSVARWGLFFLLYSLAGVLCFGLAIRPIARLLRSAGVQLLPWGILFYFLTSLGVYMGLIVRLNSWDLIKKPQTVADVALHALTTERLLKTIVVFALLLWLLYEVVNTWIDGFNMRFRAPASTRKAK